MAQVKFATAINCIDGRVQIPLIEWIKKEYSVDYVDMITTPGPEKVILGMKHTDYFKERIDISHEAHGSGVVIISGHYDCAANPISEKEHKAEIKQVVDIVRGWGYDVEVLGVWIDAAWQVEKVH